MFTQRTSSVGGCTASFYLLADIVEYLLEKTSPAESKVELGNNEGRTLLHVAALTNNDQLVTYLLDKHHASKLSVWTHKVKIKIAA